MKTSAAVAAVLLVAFAAVANAQLDFPYASCRKSLRYSYYTAEPIVLEQNGDTYCWTLRYDYGGAQCGIGEDYCCTVELDKFSLDVNGDCKSGTQLSATLNGNPLAKPIIDAPPNAGPGQFTLHVANLALNKAEAEDAKVCLTLGGKCDTLEKLIPGGNWRIALWDPNHKCCPVTTGGNPPPAPPPVCDTCFQWRLEDTLDPSAPVDYFGNAANCAAATTKVNAFVSGLKAAYPGALSGFTTVTCEDNLIKTCGSFRTAAEGLDILTPLLVDNEILNIVFDAGCDAYPGLTKVYESTDYSGDIDVTCGVTTREACQNPPPPPPPFPNCECNKALGIMPFAVSTSLESVDGMECLAVSVVEPTVEDDCNDVSVLNKIEFYLSYELRWRIAGLYIRLGDGTMIKKSQSWAVAEDNSLKVTNLDWTIAQVAELQPSICFAMKAPTTLLDLSPVEEYIFSSVFDTEKDCCSVSYAA